MVGDQVISQDQTDLLQHEYTEPCRWKGRGEGFTYRRSGIITLAFGEGEDEISVKCAFVNALGPTVVLGRDFVMDHAVWLEFDGWRPVRAHIRGKSLHCEPVQKAYLPAKNFPRNRTRHEASWD